ncbi:hypothetical protein [Inconstantimicrobium mannanitabidum]|uniref:Uncharacterized protein n=1 Tax=Inconstantimicrobium mannanitabidum TaxID=1604901 RepID=A0ACB5R838_9CLOT|nr:hypothetical protein [Clostridium sp. TW13]GKX65358.1 hypothetical protein rsdtw13_06160 [Clostridium sp. TW13]
MNTLLAGFKGKNNSAKILLDLINPRNKVNKLYLENDFSICKNQLELQIKAVNYDYVIVFGQKPVTKAICIETTAKGQQYDYQTNYEYASLVECLKFNNCKVKLSNNPGNYLCNYVYFSGLEYIIKNNLNTKLLFVHTPYLKNIISIDVVGKIFSQYIDDMMEG